MSDPKVGKKTICVLMTLRLNCLRSLEAELFRLRQTEGQIRAELLQAAPGEVRNWIADRDIVEELLRCGSASRSIPFGEGWCGDFASVNTLIRRLRAAWRPSVTVRIKRPKSDRVEVSFAVRMA